MAGAAADVARSVGPARASYTRQVKVCLAVLADLIDDPELSQQMLTDTAAALKERLP